MYNKTLTYNITVQKYAMVIYFFPSGFRYSLYQIQMLDQNIEKKSEQSKSVEKTEKKVEVEKEKEVPVGDCAVCSTIAKAICTGCKNIFYCTRDCQKKHWASHKEDCKSLLKLPYRVGLLSLMIKG